MIDAVLYVPEATGGSSGRKATFRTGERLRWVDALAEYCLRRGYTVVAVCSDLAVAISLQSEKPGRRLVLGRVDWLPDLEIITMPGTLPAINASQRRPLRRPRMLDLDEGVLDG